MQISDEHNWFQIAVSGAGAVLGGGWIYLQRQIARLRNTADKQAEQITTNSKDIAVNSAIREEMTKRHSEMMNRFDRLEVAIKQGFDKRDDAIRMGLEKADEKLERSEATLHTRINDLRDMQYGKRSGD